MRALLLALLILPAFGVARADDEDEETPKIQRYLVSLQLGDSLEQVRRVYPPASEWPATEARGGVKRYRVDRGTAKSYPPSVETLFLGFKKGKLVEIQVVYDERKSREKPVEKLAGAYALNYGESRRTGDRFWWTDGRTVFRVFPAEIPVEGEDGRSVAWRTAVQVFDQGLFDKGE